MYIFMCMFGKEEVGELSDKVPPPPPSPSYGERDVSGI